MTTLTSEEIANRIFREGESRRRLTVTPLLGPEEQIRGGSLDVRLGNYFLVFERGRVGTVNPLSGQEHISGHMEHTVYVPFMRPFVVHPHQFVLGSTLEYIGMPEDLIAYVVGRSSWGRLGLVTATAFAVHAGYRGIITLELSNIGEVPIVVYPGWPIAQMFFHRIDADATAGSSLDRSAYTLSVRPEPSRLFASAHLKALAKKFNPGL